MNLYLSIYTYSKCRIKADLFSTVLVVICLFLAKKLPCGLTTLSKWEAALSGQSSTQALRLVCCGSKSLFGGVVVKVLLQHQLPVWSQASYLTSLGPSAFISEDGVQEYLLNGILQRMLSPTVYKASRIITEKRASLKKHRSLLSYLLWVFWELRTVSLPGVLGLLTTLHPAQESALVLSSLMSEKHYSDKWEKKTLIMWAVKKATIWTTIFQQIIPM